MNVSIFHRFVRMENASTMMEATAASVRWDMNWIQQGRSVLVSGLYAGVFSRILLSDCSFLLFVCLFIVLLSACSFVCLSLPLFVCLSVNGSFRLSVLLFVFLSLPLFVCLSSLLKFDENIVSDNDNFDQICAQ